MFVLPIIFLCNTLLFVALLEERFKFLATVSVAAVAYIISMVAGFSIEGFFADPAASGPIANGICVLILFLASVFTSSNNLAQKVFTGLLLLTNYAFFTDLVPHLLGALPFGTAGIISVIFANGIFIILSLLTAAIFSRPLHYFFRRSVSPSMIGLCLLQLLCWYIAAGGANDFFNTQSFPLRFFLTLFVYCTVIFCFLSIYGGAKHKAKDIIRMSDNALMDVEADSFNTMLINVNTYRTLKKNLDYQLDRIGSMALAGRVPDIIEYVEGSKKSPVLSPLLADYSENPYLNAVVATKAAYAKEKEVNLESNIQLGDINVQLTELCILVNDLLGLAVDEASQAQDQGFVRLNLMPTGDQFSIEAVYSEPPDTEEKKQLFQGSLNDFLQDFFQPKESETKEAMGNIASIVAKHNGKLNISHSKGMVITKISIHF